MPHLNLLDIMNGIIPEKNCDWFNIWILRIRNPDLFTRMFCQKQEQQICLLLSHFPHPLRLLLEAVQVCWYWYNFRKEPQTIINQGAIVRNIAMTLFVDFFFSFTIQFFFNISVKHNQIWLKAIFFGNNTIPILGFPTCICKRGDLHC